MRHQLTLTHIDAIARHGSIRRAAEALAITPSALNRRLLALEDELGAPLFERRARGVRLSAAGELFVHHARRQIADMARVRATIEDMKGARRGHVGIAVDRSLPPARLAAMIAAHRREHPGVTFRLLPCDRGDAATLLGDYSVDLAVVLEPENGGAFATLSTLELRPVALVPEGHVLADREMLRLHDLLPHPVVLPPAGRSLRFLLDVAALRRDVILTPAIEADRFAALAVLRDGDGLGVDIRVADDTNAEDAEGRHVIPFAPTDVPPAFLHLGQLRDRPLPVPAARFAELLSRRMAALGG